MRAVGTRFREETGSTIKIYDPNFPISEDNPLPIEHLGYFYTVEYKGFEDSHFTNASPDKLYCQVLIHLDKNGPTPKKDILNQFFPNRKSDNHWCTNWAKLKKAGLIKTNKAVKGFELGPNGRKFLDENVYFPAKKANLKLTLIDPIPSFMW